MNANLAKSILLSMLAFGEMPSLQKPTLRRIKYEPWEGEPKERSKEQKEHTKKNKKNKMKRRKKRGF